MGTVAFFFVFIFLFWLVHFIKRVFEHTYLWQIKEYRPDRIKAHIEEKSTFSKILPTFSALFLAVLSLLLLKFITFTPFYLVIIIGFGYFVVSTLTFLSQAFSKSLTVPKKSPRNIIIVGLAMILAFVPLILTIVAYADYRTQTGEYVVREGTNLKISMIFPEEKQVNSERTIPVIPLETMMTVLFFLQLFLVDLFVPFIIALLSLFTSPLAYLARKKK